MSDKHSQKPSAKSSQKPFN